MINKFLLLLMTGLMFVGCAPEEEAKEDPVDCATLSVVNNASSSIYAVYYSPSTDDYWGEDKLTSTIAPGNSRSFDICSCNKNYDFLAEDIQEDSAYVGDTYIECGEDYTFTVTDFL
jgi:hypothetical protein